MTSPATRAVFGGRGFALAAVVVVLIGLSQTAETARERKAPEFPSQDPKHWVGAPQSVRGLNGRVFLLDVWTFG